MPDIHWHVGDDAEQETIAQATSPRRSRRSWIAVLIVVILGASLGMAYRSLPEPKPRPTPTPAPTIPPTPTHPAVPAKLFETIDRESQALANGDLKTFLELHVYIADEEQLRNTFQAWGRPVNDNPLYTIVDFKLRTSDKAWADIRQIRDGRSFRETRFYVWDNDRWLRDDPDPFFWNGATETLDTPHWHVIYAVEDRELARIAAAQMEELATSICVDLNCTAVTPPLTYTMNMNNYQQVGDNFSEDGQTLSLLSPRVTGIYEDAQSYRQSDELTYLIGWGIAQRIAYGRLVSSSTLPDGAIVMFAIGNWASNRANHQISIDEPRLNWVKSNLQPTRTLESLWKLGVDDDWRPAHAEAFAVVYFIEQEYGDTAVPNILKNLGLAQSFADLIEKSLGISFAEFDQKWQTWVKTHFAAP
jgi:hypothetical protein